MIGEMHGTNEPAQFVTGLAELFTSNNDSVQVSFEIPADQMQTFLKLKTDSSIFNSYFFSNAYMDGRASIAWALAIIQLNKNSRVSLFFYDRNNQEGHIDSRDSTMYIHIKTKMLEHPNWKTITISGNIHNMLLPYKGESKTGAYLKNDAQLNLKDKICSLNHLYQSGTMYNNMGKGLEVRQVDNSSLSFAKFAVYENYLYLFPDDDKNTYSGIFFTKTVTAAMLARQKPTN